MYLLDTTIVSDIVNSASSRHASAIKFVESNRLFEDQIFMSVVTLGEMRFGREIYVLRTPAPTAGQLSEIDAKVTSAERFSGPLQLTRHVATDYAKLRAAYAKGIAPGLISNGKLKSTPPERWQENLPASQLQITENDLWIAAVAITYDLILVTGDKDYQRIAIHFPSLRILHI